MKCYKCEGKVRGANKRKVKGLENVWEHKLCPGQKSYRQMRRDKLAKEA